MSNVIKLQRPIPEYAVNLLYAARNVLYGEPSMTHQFIDELTDAIIAFEEKMPVDREGHIYTRP